MLREGVPAPAELDESGLVYASTAARRPAPCIPSPWASIRPRPATVFCSMVDTVMPRADWERVWGVAVRGSRPAPISVLAITPGEEDDSPLGVRFGRGGRVVDLVDQVTTPGDWVTGGVYAFAPGTRPFAQAALAAGQHRMRDLLRRLLVAGARVETVDVARIVDLDHRRNLDAALALLAAETPD